MARQQQAAPSPWAMAKPALRRFAPKTLLLLALLGGVYWLWLQTSTLLPVKQIAVTGVMQQVDGSSLRDVVMPLVKDGFIRMDVLAVRDAIEAMPWVSRVTVRRQWPDTLALDVEEQQLLARWGDRALVNKLGELFYPENIAVAAVVPRFDGVDGLSGELAQAYQRYQVMLGTVGLSVARLQMSKRRAWKIELNNGVELVLGREPKDEHLQRFIGVYSSGLAEQAARISRVDLRYSNGFAVRWKENKVG